MRVQISSWLIRMKSENKLSEDASVWFFENKIRPISQSRGVFAEVLKRNLQQEVRVHEFPNFQLALETFLRVLLQKLLKVRSILVPCNPSFLQRQRLGENWQLQPLLVRSFSETAPNSCESALGHCRRHEGRGREQADEQMNRFWLFSELRKCFQRLC